MGSAVVLIARPRGWFGRFRKLKCLIDNEVVGQLRIGETASWDVEPGRHLVQVRMDWCTSEPMAVEIEEGQSAGFVVKSPSPWRALRKMNSEPFGFFELLPVEAPARSLDSSGS